MGDTTEAGNARTLEIVRSSCQPGKAEPEAPVKFPDGVTPDGLAKAVMRAVNIEWKDSPDRGARGRTVYNSPL